MSAILNWKESDGLRNLNTLKKPDLPAVTFYVALTVNRYYFSV